MAEDDTADNQTTPAPQPAVRKGPYLVFIFIFCLVSVLAISTPDFRYNLHPPLMSAPKVVAPTPLPDHLPKQAAVAMSAARQWRPDAVLVQIAIYKDTHFVPVFSFLSPTDGSRLEVNGGVALTVTPVDADPAGPAGPIILSFIDLPEAITSARRQGMGPDFITAKLMVLQAGKPREALVWVIQPQIDKPPYFIDAVTGLPSSSGETPPPAR